MAPKHASSVDSLPPFGRTLLLVSSIGGSRAAELSPENYRPLCCLLLAGTERFRRGSPPFQRACVSACIFFSFRSLNRACLDPPTTQNEVRNFQGGGVPIHRTPLHTCVRRVCSCVHCSGVSLLPGKEVNGIKTVASCSLSNGVDGLAC